MYSLVKENTKPGFIGIGNMGSRIAKRLLDHGYQCRRREREANHCDSKELRGMDSTSPHFKDSRERLSDS